MKENGKGEGQKGERERHHLCPASVWKGPSLGGEGRDKVERK